MKPLYPNRSESQRSMDERTSKLSALQTHLNEGADQAQRGEYTNVTADEFLNEIKSGIDDA